MKRRKKRKPPSNKILKGFFFFIIFVVFVFAVYVLQRAFLSSPSQARKPSQHITQRSPSLNRSPRRPLNFPPQLPQSLSSQPEGKAPTFIPSHPLPSSTYRIAIVIDDVGYDIPLLQEFLQLEIPLTISILPNLPYSKKSAQLAFQAGREVILHMPMQPERNFPMDSSFITLDLSSEEIEKRIGKALRSVPAAVGMSNHMGSLATQDRRVMDAVMSTIAKYNLFFLDSLTSPKSVACESARARGIPCLKRDVFLDNIDDANYVFEQVKKLVAVGKRKKKAIGIGHLKKTTLEGLKLAIPYLEEEKIEVVPLSDLL
ncbi:divergent polysaccharide deacetylase family protein [bacterium]|nr:divergent polysaccharide deacetylase family protein [bacterium]